MFENYPQLKFKGKFYELILKGSKSQTMRIPAKKLDNIKPHDMVIAIFDDRNEQLLLEITDVGYKQFRSITQEDALREGFQNISELKHELETIYTSYTLQEYDRLYYYRFILAGVAEVVQ